MATQRADMKKLIAEGNAFIANCRQKMAELEAEDRKKLSAEAKAIIANGQLKRAEAEAREKALAEAKPIIANGQLKRAEAEAHKKAEPLLTTAQWLSIIYLAASLAGFKFPYF